MLAAINKKLKILELAESTPFMFMTFEKSADFHILDYVACLFCIFK